MTEAALAKVPGDLRSAVYDILGQTKSSFPQKRVNLLRLGLNRAVVDSLETWNEPSKSTVSPSFASDIQTQPTRKASSRVGTRRRTARLSLKPSQTSSRPSSLLRLLECGARYSSERS